MVNRDIKSSAALGAPYIRYKNSESVSLRIHFYTSGTFKGGDEFSYRFAVNAGFKMNAWTAQ